MKRCVLKLMVIFTISYAQQAAAQEQEIQQLVLNVEKLAQLKNILADLKKGYEIISGGYQAIKNIAEGNFNLHEQFLDGLMQVSPGVKKYKRIGDIVRTQLRLVKEYKRAFNQFGESGRFSPEELRYITRVYENLFQQSLKNLDALAMVVTAKKLRMSDGERLQVIDALWNEVEQQLTFLRHFNSSTQLLALGRAKEGNDANTIKALYGLGN